MTISGQLTATPPIPGREMIAVTLDGVTNDPNSVSAARSTTTFDAADLQASATAYTVSYTYASRGNDASATGSSQLTVAPLAVILTGLGTYDGTTTAESNILTIANAVAGDTVDIASGSATLAGKDVGTEAITGVGTLTLGGAQASDYTLSGARGSVTITPRPITVTAMANTKTYDGTSTASALPAVTPGSLAAGDTARFTESYGSPDAGTSRTLFPSGTINDGNGGANYDVTYQTALGTINPAPLLITANNETMPFGGPVPALTASYTGFADGQTPASLATPVHVSTTATSRSSSGTYAITAEAPARRTTPSLMSTGPSPSNCRSCHRHRALETTTASSSRSLRTCWARHRTIKLLLLDGSIAERHAAANDLQQLARSRERRLLVHEGLRRRFR